MAPAVLVAPRSPAHSHQGGSVDTSDSSARKAHEPRDDVQAHGGGNEVLRRSCFYCPEGWVFLGSIGPEGEEVYESIRCRRCKGTGWIETRSSRRNPGVVGVLESDGLS
jgi:hypothetical protein